MATLVAVSRVASSTPESVAPSAGPSAPPAPSASANLPKAELPVVLGRDVPAEASPAPNAKEWSLARPVRTNRGVMEPCTMKLLREWLRVECAGLPGGGLVAGDPEGVTVRVTFSLAPSHPQFDPRAVRTVAVLPLRRSKSSIVSFLHYSFGYDDISTADAGMLSVLWRPGRPDPFLVLSILPPPDTFF